MTNYRDFYVFSTKEDADYKELYDDFAEKRYETYNKVNKYWLYVSIALLFTTLLLIHGVVSQRLPFLSITNNNFANFYIMIVLLMILDYIHINRYIQTLKLKKILSLKNCIPTNSNWRRFRLVNSVMLGLLMFIVLLNSITGLIDIISRKDYTIAEGNTVPIVRLSQIEEIKNLKPRNIHSSNKQHWNNSITFTWSFFAPIKYKVEEYGIVNNEKWENTNDEYCPNIYTQYYKLRFKKMTRGLIHDLMKENIYNKNAKPYKIKNESFDEVYVVLDDDLKKIFASWDDNVIYIDYSGKKDINRIITELSKLPENFKNKCK